MFQVISLTIQVFYSSNGLDVLKHINSNHAFSKWFTDTIFKSNRLMDHFQKES